MQGEAARQGVQAGAGDGVSVPRRREKRIEHLHAAAVPVERALLERAEVLDGEARALAEIGDISVAACDAKVEIAQQFRALAEELHWHG